MRALQLLSDRKLSIVDVPMAAEPGPGEVRVKIGAVALNHIDVWGWRGMAFAKRKLPLTIGAEAAGTIEKIGPSVEGLAVGQRVAIYGAETCGMCPACHAGRDNLCENVAGVRGFHIDGLATDYVTMKARLVVPAPEGVTVRDAACTPVTFGTVEHMLFDNAKLEAGQTILIQAGGSGIGTAAIQLARAAGATIITTVGSPEKAEKARELGAHHVINYREERFEGVVRKLTKKRGVDVVFEHVGVDTWAGSMFSLRRGGTLVTCGSTTGISAEINLFQLYQQQLRLIGSFGCRIENIAHAMGKIGTGIVTPVIDSVVDLEDIDSALDRIEQRQVFGKIIVTL
ncbi:zinc-binding dehydrogenase [Mesorhizobium sp. BR1-1-16]|uniref:Alcohol dehydrogenase n=1 Tax=Kaistia soli DSM 19436 TaxID=1122133 RepID=A0A1M5DNT2_9HYPH|nr:MULTISPECIES: zinc-binding dehydrogenase [Hyphomicrobiales]MBZ9937118.1 zinc-binding dehydrogenase [Mesorhizobium sp. BR1-1-16]SHF68643.1 alcohol dehydrogenase [Kaistia soli DSM 19436]HWJ74035.1 zinc-binding dehydrogenase [Kaistia sp.]